MSDSDDSDIYQHRAFREIHRAIRNYKKDPKTAGMFVSGWDDADEGVDEVENPEDNPTDHILWAAEKGDVNTIKELLTKQPDLVHVQDPDGYTPLHRAAYGNHAVAISYLLSGGANIHAETEVGWTPLHSACNWNNYNAVARLLAAGADPNAMSAGGQTPMHLAAAISHSKSTLVLLFLRDDVVQAAEKKNISGETPKQLALRHGIYAPLFEMVMPAMSYIHSDAFTFNPFIQKQVMIDKS
ncbi:ankyrin repeat domain-containing protein 49-like [Ostrinia furnacalis]|uniref:ankyrin repeat domain-containing protein 49-like n=1 Tax=Ostrinia furnacalis TaxID=93504 RepID=UPI00103DC9A7|nr:ankyrin repeat domain-containing protein 49-like [Ostrinia furnacalis]